MVADPIADLITRIANAAAVKKESLEMPYSKFKHSVADKLSKLGYVGDISKSGKGVSKKLSIELKYNDGVKRISEMKRISKLGKRVYWGSGDMKVFKNGVGAYVISTPQGILTDAEARKNNVGGEALFSIW